jgi:hypothetical protein
MWHPKWLSWQFKQEDRCFLTQHSSHPSLSVCFSWPINHVPHREFNTHLNQLAPDCLVTHKQAILNLSLRIYHLFLVQNMDNLRSPSSYFYISKDLTQIPNQFWPGSSFLVNSISHISSSKKEKKNCPPSFEILHTWLVKTRNQTQPRMDSQSQSSPLTRISCL